MAGNHVYHDANGCISCDCKANFGNITPCTCPVNLRLAQRVVEIEGVRRLVEQTRLFSGYDFPRESLGEMTQVRTERGYRMEVVVDENWTNLLDNCSFSILWVPLSATPRYRIRPNYPKDDSHIVRGSD